MPCVLIAFLLATTVPLICGCEGAPVDAGELRQIEDAVSEAELSTFLSIVRHLPGGKLPRLPSSALTPPAWSSSRTLPVNELYKEEQKRLRERGDVAAFARHLEGTRGLARALLREGWTVEQFAAMARTLSAAMNRTALANQDMLPLVLERGRVSLQSLEKDRRAYASLPEEAMVAVMDRAKWIPLVSRAEQLKSVPDENVQLVRQHGEALRAVFPPDTLTDSFAPFADLIRSDGVPFEELPESGLDARIPVVREGT